MGRKYQPWCCQLVSKFRNNILLFFYWSIYSCSQVFLILVQQEIFQTVHLLTIEVWKQALETSSNIAIRIKTVVWSICTRIKVITWSSCLPENWGILSMLSLCSSADHVEIQVFDTRKSEHCLCPIEKDHWNQKLI